MFQDFSKLPKPLISALAEAGLSFPTELQDKILPRISGGQTIIAIGPQGCGKTTALILAILSRLKYAIELAPRALVLVPDKESGLQLLEQFQLLGKYTDLRYLGLFAGAGAEGQRDALADGTDIVVGTPDRVQFIYNKSGLNLNKLKIFALDDAELIVQQGFHTVTLNLSESIPKCQHLVFTEVIHSKLEKLTGAFMNPAAIIEVKAQAEVQMETMETILYPVPNYKTKLNLINLLMQYGEGLDKVLVFANTFLTAGNVCKSLGKRLHGQVALFGSEDPEFYNVNSVQDFISNPELKVLVCHHEQKVSDGFDGATALVHFDVPLDKDLFIQRIAWKENRQDMLCFIFSTDAELSLVKKMEQEIGSEFPMEALPPGLIIEGDRSAKREEEGSATLEVSTGGGAFHEKKESNAKEYNYKFKDRLKMFGKKNRRGKRL